MKPMYFPHRVEQRRKESEERDLAWKALTPQQQWDALDLRLGKNQGAKKQRKKLAVKLGITYK